MSLAELLPSVASLPRGDKIQLLQFVANELARDEERAELERTYGLKPEDNCPYTAKELEQMFQETGGVPLSEIWRKLGAT
jgi:hypothetical protein